MDEEKKAQDNKRQAALAARRINEGRGRLEIKPAPLKEHHNGIKDVARALERKVLTIVELELWLIEMEMRV